MECELATERSGEVKAVSTKSGMVELRAEGMSGTAEFRKTLLQGASVRFACTAVSDNAKADPKRENPTTKKTVQEVDRKNHAAINVDRIDGS
jgi:hypothetical protein